MDKKPDKPPCKLFGTVFIVCVIVLLFSMDRPSCERAPCDSQSRDIATGITESFPGSCTTFAASHGNTVLFGNNEDFNNPDTYLWVVEPGEGTYGGVYFGYSYGRPQGGINEKGLAFDALALPATRLNPHPELPPKGSADTQFLGKIMNHSATVEDAITFAQSFNWGSSISFQVLLADAAGDAVIISAGPDGEMVFTWKPEGDGYLVGTNFNRANPENRFGARPCWRYDKSVSMLAQIESEADLDADYLGSILDAVHVEGAEQNTLYSNVFDLRNGVIYLYYWHQYDVVVTLNVAEQIGAGLTLTNISDLFSRETVSRAAEEYQRHVEQAARDDWLNRNGKAVIAGGGVTILGLFGIVVYILRRRKNMSKNDNEGSPMRITCKGLCLAIGLLFGGIVGLLIGNPIIFAGGGLVLGLGIGSALDNRR